MENVKKIKLCEAILFASGEPIELEQIAIALETDIEEILQLVGELNDRYEQTESAFVIKRLGDLYQMATRTECADAVKTALEVKKSTPLSNAAMEVLAVAAYNQPVTKGFIENVRGVDSSSVVNTLVEKGLLEEAGRLEVPGRPIAYKTTANFLRCFDLSGLEDLPSLPQTETEEDIQNISQEINEVMESISDKDEEETETV